MNEEKRDSAHLLSLSYSFDGKRTQGTEHQSSKDNTSVKEMPTSKIGIQVEKVVENLHTGAVERIVNAIFAGDLP